MNTNDLQYKLLSSSGIMNARIAVKPLVQVSISYSLPNSCYQSVGTKEQPQIAILLCANGIEDLYAWDDRGSTNIQNEATFADIGRLLRIAEALNPTHCIHVWDTAGKEEKSWLPRFIVQKDTGDYKAKSQYATSIWGKKIMETAL